MFRENPQGVVLKMTNTISPTPLRHQTSMTHRIMSSGPEIVKILLTADTALLNRLWLEQKCLIDLTDISAILVECNRVRGGLQAASALQGAEFDFQGHQ